MESVASQGSGHAAGAARAMRVALETSTHSIRATVTLPPADGYRSRLSDFLNRPDAAFIALTEAEMTPRGEGSSTKHPFLALARSAVVLAYPLEGEDAR